MRAGAVADLKAIPAWIFKENGIVSWLIVKRPLDMAGAGTCRHFRETVNLAHALGPEGDPSLVGDMVRSLCDAEKLCDASVPRLKLQPAFDRGIACESKRRQERLIKRPYFGKATHSEINVIETTPHKWNRFKWKITSQR